MKRKKVVLVIVEGPSDEDALGAVLNNYFDKDRVYVHTHHGDITTEKGNKCSNIISKVNECVKQCRYFNTCKTQKPSKTA